MAAIRNPRIRVISSIYFHFATDQLRLILDISPFHALVLSAYMGRRFSFYPIALTNIFNHITHREYNSSEIFDSILIIFWVYIKYLTLYGREIIWLAYFKNIYLDIRY